MSPWFVSAITGYLLIIILSVILILKYYNTAKQKSRENEISKLQITKLDLIAKAADVGLWDFFIQDTDPFSLSNVNIYSDRFRHLLGFTDQEDFPDVLGSWAELLHPDDKEKVFNALAAHLFNTTGKTPFNVECRLMKKDGTFAYFLSSCETVRDKDGYPLRACGLLMDITDETQRRERMRLMLDTSPMCIGIWDSSHKIIDCNKATLELYGFKSKQEYIDRFAKDCIPKFQPDGSHSYKKATELLNKALADGYCFFEWTLKKPNDGTTITTEVTLVRVNYIDGDVVVGYTRVLN